MMCAKRRILVADDDAGMRRACRAMFESDGYEVVAAKDGADALAKFDAGRFDLVVLDVMMPKMNGLDACAEIRRRDALTPVLFFTAMPSEASAVKALGHGADDYVEKSRPPEELRARVRAALRRADAYGDAARRGGGEVAEDLRIGGVRADFATLTVEQNGRSTPLTKSEALVLRLLAGSPGRFFSREEILAEVRGAGHEGDDGALRVLVSRLKRKLGAAGGMIVNARGSGYKFLK